MDQGRRIAVKNFLGWQVILGAIGIAAGLWYNNVPIALSYFYGTAGWVLACWYHNDAGYK
jgi:hypothetical protein